LDAGISAVIRMILGPLAQQRSRALRWHAKHRFVQGPLPGGWAKILRQPQGPEDRETTQKSSPSDAMRRQDSGGLALRMSRDPRAKPVSASRRLEPRRPTR